MPLLNANRLLPKLILIYEFNNLKYSKFLMASNFEWERGIADISPVILVVVLLNFLINFSFLVLRFTFANTICLPVAAR